MDRPIAFESITQTHLLVLTEYMKMRQSLPVQARNCRMSLTHYKSVLTEALGLAGEISYWLPKGKAREKLKHFFDRWDAEGHTPAPEPIKIEPYEPAPPRVRPCNALIVHDPELSLRQMECLRQFVTQRNIVRAAEAMKLPKGKFRREVDMGLARAASLCRKPRSADPLTLSKGEQVRLIHLYFDLLESQAITMDDPAF